MPLQEHHQIVSVDDHLIEHPRVWQDRVPAKFREQAPRIVEVNDNHMWTYEGNMSPTIGLNAVAGKPPEQWGVDPIRYEDMIPGCYDPVARVADMDLDGVQSALCFPSFPGFAGSVFFKSKDKDLALSCVKAWNDFHIDEWCASAPKRFVPLAILPFWDIDATAEEARRVIAKGARSLSFPDSPTPLGLPTFFTRHWDPLWQICSEASVPVSLHFGSGTFVPGFAYSTSSPGNDMVLDSAPFLVPITLFASNLMWTSIELIFSGALQRFPQLQFSLSEGGIGWIPYLLERADKSWRGHRHYQDVDRNTPPSELFRRHFWGCFIDDEHGLANRYAVGVNRITLEIDYPHSDTNWPNSRKRAAEFLADVPDDEAQLIAEDNARRMLNFPRTS
ncbi:amidohydrolase family protein [Mycobacterium sp. MUNTM1]